MGAIAEEEREGEEEEDRGVEPLVLPSYYPTDYYSSHTPISSARGAQLVIAIITYYYYYFVIELSGTLQRHKSRIRREEKQPVPSYDESQYRPPFKILGGRTLKLLNFRYKHVPPSTHQKLDELEQKGFHR